MAKKKTTSKSNPLESFIYGKTPTEMKKGLTKTQKIQILTITTILGFVGLITVVLLALFDII